VTLISLASATDSGVTPYLSAILSKNSPSFTTCISGSTVGLGRNVGTAEGVREDVQEGVTVGVAVAHRVGLGVVLTSVEVDLTATGISVSVEITVVIGIGAAVATDAKSDVGFAVIVDSYQGLTSQTAPTTTPSARRLPSAVQTRLRRRVPLI